MDRPGAVHCSRSSRAHATARCTRSSPLARSCAGTAISSAAAGPPDPDRRGQGDHRPTATSSAWCCAWRPTTSIGGTGGSPASWPGSAFAVAPSTVWEILKRHGIHPAPRRAGPDWAQFLRSQAEAILALDLFTVDLLDGTKAYVLAAIEHATRRIRILGATAHPGGQWIVQQARNCLSTSDSQRISPNALIALSASWSQVSPRNPAAKTLGARLMLWSRPTMGDLMGTVGPLDCGCPWCLPFDSSASGGTSLRAVDSSVPADLIWAPTTGAGSVRRS